MSDSDLAYSNDTVSKMGFDYLRRGAGNQTSPDYLYDDSDITFVDNNNPTNTFNSRGDNMDTQYNIKGFSSPAGDQFGGGNNSQPNLAATAGIIRGAAGVMQGLMGREGRRNAQIDAQGAYDDLLTEYRNLDTSNIWANVENKYTNLQNPYEDLTVNQQQAEFERDMFQQQQVNVMSNLAGAAGGSGIAGLAQAMANQGLIARRQASASIGMQESANQLAQAQAAMKIQEMERAGESQAEQMRLRGAETARALEWQRTATELGMSQQDLAAANQAQAQGKAALWGGIGSIAGGVIGGPIGASIGGTIGGMIGRQ